MGKPVLKNENDVERWRELWKELIDQMDKDGLTKNDMYALLGSWATELVPNVE